MEQVSFRGVSPHVTARYFKLFAAPIGELNSFINEQKSDRCCVEYEERFWDITVKISYAENAYKSVVDDLIDRFTIRFSAYIYAKEDQTLASVLVSLLRKTNKVISTAESFTGGGVASAIVSVSGASAVFYEGIVAYNKRAKMQRLGVNPATLEKFGAVSNETAYEMALSLLMTKTCSFAISTTGLAGPLSDESGLPAGLFYVAVGDDSGIHVHRYELCGDRNYVINVGINAALYHAIIKLKNY